MPIWPWPEENGKMNEVTIYPEETVRVFEVLRRWFHGMESGEAQYWSYDPRYERPNGKPPFTEAQVNELIEVALDEYLDAPAQRNYAKNTRGIFNDAGPGFSRLAFPQRLALAQQLEQALDPDKPVEPTMDPNSGMPLD